ncbi:MAG: PAS domain S-box protein [Chloroflexi bacterium]|nr:PAS domain S-box protein [Chloroflexota bacterium]
MPTLDARLTQLVEIQVMLSSSPLPGQHFQVLAEHAHRAIPHQFLAFCLKDADVEGYFLHVLAGPTNGAIPLRVYGLAEGVAGQVLRTNQTSHVADLAVVENRCADIEEVLLAQGLRSVVVVPVRQGSEPLGALYFAAADRPFSPEDVQIARLLAAGLSGSLENARLYQSLADERSTLAAVLESTQDAIIMVNQQGVVLLANPAVAKMVGLDATALTGRVWQDAAANTLVHDLFTGSQPALREIALDGNRVAQVAVLPVTTAYGEPVGWAAVFHDITLLKQLEQMKTTFVNTVSHDLKNPIGTIMLSADLMPRMAPLTPQQEDLRGRIVNTANYMNQLVTDLLDLGKLEAGIANNLEILDLNGLIEQAVATLALQIEEKQMDVKVSLPQAVKLRGDRGRMTQVLVNLISNAVKYTPAQGQVWVKIAPGATGPLPPSEDQARTFITVSVQDTGIGIAPADLPYVFDEFYRVRNEATENIKGTGLGLAIVKRIIEAHQGYIWVESVEGKGSTFSFFLPMA